eukprot:m.260552 g.260552  ORF g.260552 m.260552 type:complete len:66 (+) comp321361_c0_seq1:215-412(+)
MAAVSFPVWFSLLEFFRGVLFLFCLLFFLSWVQIGPISLCPFLSNLCFYFSLLYQLEAHFSHSIW